MYTTPKTIKVNIPIGMLLTDIDLSDDTNILIQENGVTILGQDANTKFCKT